MASSGANPPPSTPRAGERAARLLGSPPGTGWAYNDVRVNLLCLALTALLERPLPDVLAERVMEPLGVSATWS